MARKRRQIGTPGAATSVVTVAIGDVDQSNPIDLAVPSDKAYVVSVSYVTKTAGATTGTFTATLRTGTAAIAEAVTIDADAVAGTYHGSGEGTKAPLTEGDRLNILTAKTGTVSTGVILIVTVNWGF